jgi:hypothetical protein
VVGDEREGLRYIDGKRLQFDCSCLGIDGDHGFGKNGGRRKAWDREVYISFWWRWLIGGTGKSAFLNITLILISGSIAEKCFRLGRAYRGRGSFKFYCAPETAYTPKPLRPVTLHHRENVIKLVSIPFHQQKPKQMAHVEPRITPKPTRLESFHDQASLPYTIGSALWC